MSDETLYPYQAGGKITKETHEQMIEAKKKFGATPGALTRMALEAYMPGYLAAQGRTEDIETLAKVSAALIECPAIKDKLNEFLENALRPDGPVPTRRRRAA